MNLNKNLSLLLLALALLFVQAGGLAHGISHTLAAQDQTQPQDKLCDLCASYAQTGNVLSSTPFIFDIQSGDFEYISIYSNRYEKSSFSAFTARAPPYFV